MHTCIPQQVRRSELIFAETPRVLGRGTFGLVVEARYRGTLVAVKRALPAYDTEQRNDIFDQDVLADGAVSVPAMRHAEAAADQVCICVCVCVCVRV